MIIYKTTNTVNGKFYVGKDAANNPRYLGSGFRLTRAIKKYGRENFRKDILETCTSLEHLSEREIFWIDKLDALNRRIAYNLTAGGSGGDTFIRLSAARRKRKMNALARGAKTWWENGGRKVASDRGVKMWQNMDIRQQITDKLKGRKITWADKISAAHLERNKTFVRPAVSEATREKLSVAAKGKELSEIDSTTEILICELYKGVGPKRMSVILADRGIQASPYLIRRTLNKYGIYQKGRKRIGERSDTEKLLLRIPK